MGGFHPSAMAGDEGQFHIPHHNMNAAHLGKPLADMKTARTETGAAPYRIIPAG
jgi:hypothetical protein